MDTIFLRDLRIRTIVGIWEWERRMPQIVSIDLDMGTDIRRAARSDQIEDTLDYKGVTRTREGPGCRLQLQSDRDDG